LSNIELKYWYVNLAIKIIYQLKKRLIFEGIALVTLARKKKMINKNLFKLKSISLQIDHHYNLNLLFYF